MATEFETQTTLIDSIQTTACYIEQSFDMFLSPNEVEFSYSFDECRGDIESLLDDLVVDYETLFDLWIKHHYDDKELEEKLDLMDDFACDVRTNLMRLEKGIYNIEIPTLRIDAHVNLPSSPSVEITPAYENCLVTHEPFNPSEPVDENSPLWSDENHNNPSFSCGNSPVLDVNTNSANPVEVSAPASRSGSESDSVINGDNSEDYNESDTDSNLSLADDSGPIEMKPTSGNIVSEPPNDSFVKNEPTCSENAPNAFNNFPVSGSIENKPTCSKNLQRASNYDMPKRTNEINTNLNLVSLNPFILSAVLQINYFVTLLRVLVIPLLILSVLGRQFPSLMLNPANFRTNSRF